MISIKTLIKTRAAGHPGDKYSLERDLTRLKQAKHALEYFGEDNIDWDDLELIDLIGFGNFLKMHQNITKRMFQNERYSMGFYNDLRG